MSPRFVAATFATLAGFVGCWLELLNTHGHAAVRWHFDERVDPASCAAHGIDRVQVRALDAAGNAKAVLTAPCGDFLASTSLERGWYTAEVTMLDANALPASSTLHTRGFYVPYHGRVVAEVDFPESAFTTTAV